MKYIRTKDGIFERKFPNKEHKMSFDHKTIEPAYYTVKYDWIAKKDVIKQSDNLDDLFDEFVYCYKGAKPELVDKEKIKTLTLLGLTKYVYGAIWTDKGLIYVARMNKEGKWELL